MQSSLRQEDPNPMPISLPEELIADILTRLPVTSLLRFKCVSKPWRSMISSSHFIKSHLKKSAESPDYANQTLLLISIGCPVQIHSCPLRSVLLISSNSPLNLDVADPPKRILYPQLSLLGCCNGIFAILEGAHGLILWNPTLKKSKILPDPGTNYRMYRIFSYGFGYDALNDDYKVVEMCCYCRFGINRETIVNVYSLKSNSWRRIKDYEGGLISFFPAVFVAGILHWLVVHKEGLNSSWTILSLDLSTEEYCGELTQPRYDDGNFSLSLGVLEGRLCVFCNYGGQLRVDVWMMKEYGKKESWFKFASIPYAGGSRGCPSPLFVSKSGEILVRGGHRLMLYDRADGRFRECEFKTFGQSFTGTAAAYSESLVSTHLHDNDISGEQN